MNRWARIGGPGGSVQTPHRLQRSGAIALIFMVDLPYFRVAGGQADGCAPAGCQEQFDAAAPLRHAEHASAVHPAQPPGAQGLGVFGDAMLASDLSG
jgi:hypothetical protein